MVKLAEGAEITTVGFVLSTEKVVLGPAAKVLFPAVSVAVPAARLMPKVPSPVMLEIVTVRVRPVPVTATVPLAVPVIFNVMSEVAKVLALKFASA